jgi:acyl dehydratase
MNRVATPCTIPAFAVRVPAMNNGDSLTSSPLTLDEEKITDFAGRFDPQPYHLDRAAAEASIFGGLCASGWQVAALASRLTGEALQRAGIHYVTTTHVSRLNWLKPTFAGDSLVALVSPGERQAGSSIAGCDSMAVAVLIQDQNGRDVAKMDCSVAVIAEPTP